MTDNTQPEAVGAGGAQALSAAPGEQLTREQIREVFMAHGFTIKEGQNDLKQYVYDAAYALLELVAAPQQEPAAYIHAPHHTVEGKVRPVVSFEKYQQDYADGIYSTRIPLYTASSPAPAPLSDAQIKELIEDGVFLGNCKEIVRAIEHAHGITQKGGSNAE